MVTKYHFLVCNFVADFSSTLSCPRMYIQGTFVFEIQNEQDTMQGIRERFLGRSVSQEKWDTIGQGR